MQKQGETRSLSRHDARTLKCTTQHCRHQRGEIDMCVNQAEVFFISV